jgi:hypothetical protein
MRNCKTALTALTIFLAMTFSVILVTYMTADSFAQTNATTTGNQSSMNSTGSLNSTAVDEGSGGISGYKGR